MRPVQTESIAQPRILPALSYLRKVDMSSTTMAGWNRPWSTGVVGRVVICAGTRDPHRPTCRRRSVGGGPTLLGLGIQHVCFHPTHTPIFFFFFSYSSAAIDRHPPRLKKVRITKVVTKYYYFFPHLP